MFLGEHLFTVHWHHIITEPTTGIGKANVVVNAKIETLLSYLCPPVSLPCISFMYTSNTTENVMDYNNDECKLIQTEVRVVLYLGHGLSERLGIKYVTNAMSD